jgi:Cdc6-like AAA superfamily ATPase
MGDIFAPALEFLGVNAWQGVGAIIGLLSLLLAGYVAWRGRGRSADGTTIRGDQVAGDSVGVDKVGRDKVTYNYYTGSAPDTARERRNRAAMLQKVHDTWIAGVLDHSLRQAVFIELGLQRQQTALADPRNLHLYRFGAPDQPLPAGTSISSVFDSVGGELLILGAPGAGKTTLLLELARTLLERAQQDEAHPIPVVLNLSSWARKRADTQKAPPTLAAWLETELVDTYDVPRKLAQHWIADDRLLPLLDGLDEVPADQRAACVAAINTFRHAREQQILPLVVCSRIDDYKLLNTDLNLVGCQAKNDMFIPTPDRASSI